MAWIGWVFTGLQLVGCILLASAKYPPWACYIILLVTAIVLGVRVFVRKDYPTTALMVGFVLINSFGIYSWSHK